MNTCCVVDTDCGEVIFIPLGREDGGIIIIKKQQVIVYKLMNFQSYLAVSLDIVVIGSCIIQYLNKEENM